MLISAECNKFEVQNEVFRQGLFQLIIPNLQEAVDLFTSTEEIHNGTLHFLSSERGVSRIIHIFF